MDDQLEIIEKYLAIKEKVRIVYSEKKSIYSPYFKQHIVLNSDGFHHLQFSTRKERNKKEQILKLQLVPLALDVIAHAGTVQEYRTLLTALGKKGIDGFIKMKEVEYWGFVAIMGEKKKKIRVVLRKVGAGNIMFWSVMPYSKIKNGKQKLYSEGLEDE